MLFNSMWQWHNYLRSCRDCTEMLSSKTVLYRALPTTDNMLHLNNNVNKAYTNISFSTLFSFIRVVWYLEDSWSLFLNEIKKDKNENWRFTSVTDPIRPPPPRHITQTFFSPCQLTSRSQLSFNKCLLSITMKCICDYVKFKLRMHF